jgi:phage shock protein E
LQSKLESILAMKTKLYMLAGSVVLSLLLCGQAVAADITKDPLPTVQENLASSKAVIVDMREPEEWKDGHLAGAISLPLSALRRGVDPKDLDKQLPKDKIIYTHCVVGMRALAAAKILEKLGYNVRPLKPGYEELVKAGFKKSAD